MNVTLQRKLVRISSSACMRTEPESWSGVSMQASTTSTRRCAQRSRSMPGYEPLVRCVASVAPHFRAKVRLIDHLMALDAGRFVGARRLALEMDDGGAAAGRRPDGRPRAPRTRGRCPRNRPARSACRSHPARGTPTRKPQGMRRSSSRPRAGSCTRASRDRRRGRDSTPSRRARRCRRLPAGARRDRSIWPRRGPACGWSRKTASSASSQPAVTIVSLLRNTRMSPRAASAARLQVTRKPWFSALRRYTGPTTSAERVGRGLG